jgi:hypothetical protein
MRRANSPFYDVISTFDTKQSPRLARTRGYVLPCALCWRQAGFVVAIPLRRCDFDLESGRNLAKIGLSILAAI